MLSDGKKTQMLSDDAQYRLPRQLPNTGPVADYVIDKNFSPKQNMFMCHTSIMIFIF